MKMLNNSLEKKFVWVDVECFIYNKGKIYWSVNIHNISYNKQEKYLLWFLRQDI